jgi:hypothetical protein
VSPAQAPGAQLDWTAGLGTWSRASEGCCRRSWDESDVAVGWAVRRQVTHDGASPSLEPRRRDDDRMDKQPPSSWSGQEWSGWV